MGQLLWAKLAEGLNMSEPDHGKIEGLCASGSLAAYRCDFMTSDPFHTHLEVGQTESWQGDREPLRLLTRKCSYK